jgi:hypothetical protein
LSCLQDYHEFFVLSHRHFDVGYLLLEKWLFRSNHASDFGDMVPL